MAICNACNSRHFLYKPRFRSIINPTDTLSRKIAARLGGMAEGVYSCHLRQMMTKKPLNIDDEDIFDGMSRFERPYSQPTRMSYPLLRIRLGEISRRIVDRYPLVMGEPPSYDVIMEIDTEIQGILNELPEFFSMSKAQLIDTFKLNPAQATNILYQGHTSYLILYGDRCKLHLPYFTRGFVDRTYSPSREMCIKCARVIMQTEKHLRSSGQPAALRFKFCGFLMGVFMACTVLLMDLCIGTSSPQRGKQRGEVADALRLLEEAKHESETTFKFVESWMHILRKYQVPPPETGPNLQIHPESGNEQLQTPSTDQITYDTPTPPAYGGSLRTMPREITSSMLGVSDNTGPAVTDGPSNGEDISSYFNDLAQSLEQGIDPGNFDWNNIFSDLGSSFI